MAGYLEQIPKQLAARRKAVAAVEKNPALQASYWSIIRQIANNAYEYMRNSVVGGCTFPDRPIYLSADDAAFLNFGTTPAMLRQDFINLVAEAKGEEPPQGDTPLPPEIETKYSHRLADAVKSFGRNHVATRVYSLEPWLQEMYRDCLDVDYAEELQRQIDRLNAYMDSVPKALNATGLAGGLAKAVMDSFNLFKTITGSSHQLERDKMSFTDRRGFVNTSQQIEATMVKADEALGAAAAGRSPVRELFNFWKDANYEMMKYTRQLRLLWAGTSLDDRIMDLAKMLSAVQNALNRCSDQDPQPEPQLPILRADDNSKHISRKRIIEAFQSIMNHDLILAGESALSRNETRRFGPLSVLIAPGRGVPRYCMEIRKIGAEALDEDEKKNSKTKSFASQEREMEVDRRVRYPMNCIVVPTRASKDTLLQGMADAWLEFNQAAYPTNFKGALDEVKRIAPALFLPPEGVEAKELSPHYARQAFGKLVAVFCQWARNGKEPDAEAIPDFEAFREWALARLGVPKLIIPMRYRPIVELFAESGAKRRTEMWRRYLGPRFTLDRQLVAVNVLQKDWTALKDNLKYLPLNLTQGNINLDSGFTKARDGSDPMRDYKALAFFRRFLMDDPDLKTAMVTVESQISIEMETLRSQAESLGRAFQYDQVSLAMMRRQASQIQEKRNVANNHIDQYLTGLMYAHDNNYEAAIVALTMCLTPPGKRKIDDVPLPEIPEGIDQQWFNVNLPPLESPFEKKTVPGENSLGTICFDQVYFNLGRIYMKMDRYVEAGMCFRGYLESADKNKEHAFIVFATDLAAEAKAKIAEETAKDDKARETANAS